VVKDMEKIFIATLNQMLVLFIIMIIGYILNKARITGENTGTILSRLLSNIAMPALCFQTFAKNLTRDTIYEKFYIFLCGTCILLGSLALAYFLAKIFSKDEYVRRIYTYSFTTANLGYIGYPVVGGVFGQEALLDMMIFCIPFNIFIYSLGIAMLKPGSGKISFRGLVNPVFICMILGAIVGFFNIPLPEFISSTVSSLAACMSTLAMLLAGFVIAQYDFKKLILNGRIYIASILRLIVIPGAIMLVLNRIGVSHQVLIAALGTTAMPLGLNTIVFPAAYGGDTSTGASMALISNILSIITIPIMFSIFLL